MKNKIKKKVLEQLLSSDTKTSKPNDLLKGFLKEQQKANETLSSEKFINYTFQWQNILRPNKS